MVRVALALIAFAAMAQTTASPQSPDALAHPETWPRAADPVPASSAIEARLDRLLATMTLEEKVGQTIMADVASIKPEDLRAYPLGAILNGGESSPRGYADAPIEEWLSAADAFQAAATGRSGVAIPILWGTDAVHGDNRIRGATIFPHNIGLGAGRDPDLMRRIGAVTAAEVVATGQDWAFAPTVAVVQDPRWGRTYESYAQDPRIVADYAAALVEGLQGRIGADFLGPNHVIATAKHFLGDGGTEGGRDQGDTVVPEVVLRDVHAAGYVAAIHAGVQAVMVSYSSWNGVKMHGNESLLTGVLKRQMGFGGVLVGDWNGHAEVPGCSKESCPAAYAAGIDMIMAPDGWKAFFANTVRQVRDGEIPLARIEDAARRILRVKLRAGLFDKPKPSQRPGGGDFARLGAPEHRAVAREAVRESLVLLKNNRALLPLARKAHALVIGAAADDIGWQCGGWTLSWQGRLQHNADFPHATSIFAGIAEAVQGAGGSATLSPDGSFAERPDVAIVVFGEPPYAETKGDRETLSAGAADPAGLPALQRLKAAGIPVIAILLSGRPLWATPEIDAADAFVAAWLPGTEGGGIADLLFRAPDGAVAHDFRGVLPFPWPRTEAPGAAGWGTPLFPVGYGLRYAQPKDLGPLRQR